MRYREIIVESDFGDSTVGTIAQNAAKKLGLSVLGSLGSKKADGQNNLLTATDALMDRYRKFIGSTRRNQTFGTAREFVFRMFPGMQTPKFDKMFPMSKYVPATVPTPAAAPGNNATMTAPSQPNTPASPSVAAPDAPVASTASVPSPSPAEPIPDQPINRGQLNRFFEDVAVLAIDAGLVTFSMDNHEGGVGKASSGDDDSNLSQNMFSTNFTPYLSCKFNTKHFSDYLKNGHKIASDVQNFALKHMTGNLSEFLKGLATQKLEAVVFCAALSGITTLQDINDTKAANNLWKMKFDIEKLKDDVSAEDLKFIPQDTKDKIINLSTPNVTFGSMMDGLKKLDRMYITGNGMLCLLACLV